MASSYDATVTAKLESAGAVLLGKLSLTEGAMAGYHRDFKAPRNPWDLHRTPGFSSSGSGVATAAGMSYGTIGSDTGGSLRLPASATGVVGLKPTWGRVSRYGVVALAPSLDHIGPMTRRVEDAAALLSVIAGEDCNDPTSLVGPAGDHSKNLDNGIDGVRIGFDESYATKDVAQHVADAIDVAVGELERLGARIVPVKLPDMAGDEVINAWLTITSVEALQAHERTYPRAAEYGAFFRNLLDNAVRIPATAYAKPMQFRGKTAGGIPPAASGPGIRNGNAVASAASTSPVARETPNGMGGEGGGCAGIGRKPSLKQAHRWASGLRGSEKPAVGSKHRTVAFQRQGQVNTIPQGYSVLQRQSERGGQQRRHVEQTGRTIHHQTEGGLSLIRGHLFPAVTLCRQTGEFRQEKIGSDQQNLSRSVAVEQSEGRRAVRLREHPLSSDAAVENQFLRHALSLPLRANQGRTVVHRRQGGRKAIEFFT